MYAKPGIADAGICHYSASLPQMLLGIYDVPAVVKTTRVTAFSELMS